MTTDEDLDEASNERDCLICGDLGWVLDGHPAREPLVLDLAPCPDACRHAGRQLEVLAVHGMFARAVLHGGTGAVMSLTGSIPLTETALPPHLAPPPTVPSPGPSRPAGAPTRIPPRSPLPPGARPTGPGR